MATKTAKPAVSNAPKAGDKSAVNTPELDRLLTAVRTAVKAYDGKMKTRETATKNALVAKVTACRAIITLMADPATFASRGPSAGKPSVSIIAELLGYPRQSFTPLFKGAEALQAYYATLDAETVAAIFKGQAPTEAETDLASVGLTSEADRARANRLKAKKAPADKGTDKGTGDTDGDDTDGDTETAGRTAETPGVPTYEKVVAATLALQEIVKAYCREAGFSEVQGDNLTDTLQEISTLIESHKVSGGDS
jgi:hypothetical protein